VSNIVQSFVVQAWLLALRLIALAVNGLYPLVLIHYLLVASPFCSPKISKKVLNHSGNVSSSSVNGDIAFLWEWSNFDHS